MTSTPSKLRRLWVSRLGSLIVVFLLVGWAFSLAGIENASKALEGVVILVLLFSARLERSAIIIIFFLFLLMLLQYAHAVSGGLVDWQDFVRSVKPWIYLGLFALCDKRIVSKDGSRLQWALAIFAIGYTVSFALGESRPFLITENNFELPLVISTWAAIIVGGKRRLFSVHTLLAAYVVALSMSRSGAVSFLVVLLMLVVRQRIAQSGPSENRGKVSWARIVKFVWIVPVLVAVAYFVFQERAIHGFQIDRLTFLESFVAASSAKPVLQVLIGSGALAQIPRAYCTGLSFYLESLAGAHGECFSVVWHAGLVRLLFDFGLVGAFLIYFGFFKLLRRRFSRYDSLLGIAPIFLAGLSVGGIYNYLSLLGLFIFFVFARRAPNVVS